MTRAACRDRFDRGFCGFHSVRISANMSKSGTWLLVYRPHLEWEVGPGLSPRQGRLWTCPASSIQTST